MSGEPTKRAAEDGQIYEALLRISRVIQEIDRASDLAGVVQVFYDQLRMLGLDFYALTLRRLLDEDRKLFRVHQVRPNGDYQVKVGVQEGIFIEWKAGEVIYRPDLENDSTVRSAPGYLDRLQKGIGAPIRSLLHVPYAGGMITLRSISVDPFTEVDINLVRRVSEMLALGLRRVQDMEELAAARDQAEAASRAKSTFIGRMSHELRTPLNAILGFTQIMTRDGTVSPEHRENLEVVNRSGEHLLGLINDVLEMSRSEAGQMKVNRARFDLHRLLDSLEGMFRLRAREKGLRLICDRDSDLPRYVYTDEAKLLKVLIHLLDNAIKFTEAGGVTLRAAYRSESSRLLFEVEDSGSGIAPEEIESLFEAFVQPDVGNLAQEGLGLGLPISQQYVRLMDGEITVSSQVGRGSIFKFDVQIELTEHLGAGVKQEGSDRIAALAQTEDTLTPPVEADWKEIELPSDLYSSLVSAVEAHSITELRGVLDRLREEAPDLAEHLSQLARQFDMDGIKAVLEEINSRDSELASREMLTPEALSVLPAAWRSNLLDAARRADTEAVVALLHQIKIEQADLARELMNLVHDFRFDRIMELAQVGQDAP